VTLKDLFAERGNPPLDGLALLAGTDKATISRISNGRQRARPETVVKLARALGVSARRMKAMCDASWAAAHEGQDEAEWLPVA
jgi:plasmid maintenance system antidote protein VapI